MWSVYHTGLKTRDNEYLCGLLFVNRQRTRKVIVISWRLTVDNEQGISIWSFGDCSVDNGVTSLWSLRNLSQTMGNRYINVVFWILISQQTMDDHHQSGLLELDILRQDM
jgi:hypothetical protein